PGERRRYDESADRRGGAQDAESPRAGGKNIAGEDRQERDGSTEQHREQIEHDRSQHDRITADERDSGEQALRSDGLPRRRERRGAKQKEESAADEEQRAAQRVNEDGAHRVEQAAARGPADHADLARGRRGGDGARQQRRGDERGKERRNGRRLEG